MADACGCVYGCGVGDAAGPDGRYTVRGGAWTSALEGRVSDWCVAGRCTPAFHVALECDGICAPRAADSTCDFRGGRCVTGRPDALLDGAYQVRWARGGAVAGAIALHDGTYHWVGRAPGPGQRTFAFVARPTGPYSVEMRTPAVGQRAGDLRDGATLAVVDFAPGDTTVPEAQRRVEVRNDRARGVRYFHSVVSEFETWQIETLPEAPAR